MKALRWILFALVAFAAGTGVALVVHPPTIGIPTASASALSDDLTKVNEYASSGQCSAVRGRLRGADATIDDLPSRTSAATIDQLTSALRKVRTQALSTCQRVYEAQQEREQQQQESEEPTTPAETPVPTDTPPPATTPDDGTGDQGTTPDGGISPGAGGDDGTGGPGGDGGPGTGNDGGGQGGGITLPNGAAVRQQLEQARDRLEQQIDQARRGWGQ